MDSYTRKFKALSDLTRLRALRLVLQSGQEVCVCELVDALQLPQYQVSKHLSVLKQAGLVEDCRVGTWVYYSIPQDASKFVEGLCRLVADDVVGPVFEADAARLKERLKARTDGRCVVGTRGAKLRRRRSVRDQEQGKTSAH